MKNSRLPKLGLGMGTSAVSLLLVSQSALAVSVSPNSVSGYVGRPINATFNFNPDAGCSITAIAPTNLASGASFNRSGNLAYYSWANPIALNNATLQVKVTQMCAWMRSDKYVGITFNVSAAPVAPATASPTHVNGTAGTPLHVTYTFTSGVPIQKVEALGLAPGARFVPSISGTNATAAYDWGSPIAMNGGILNLRLTDVNGKATTFPITYNIAAAAPATVTPTSVNGTAGTPLHVSYTFTSGIPIQRIDVLNLASGARFSPSINGTSATASYDWDSPVAMTGGHLNLKLVDVQGKETPFSIVYNIAAAAPATVTPTSVSGTAGTPIHATFNFTSGISIQKVEALNLASGARFSPSINGKSATATYDWDNPIAMTGGYLNLKVTDTHGKETPFSIAFNIAAAAPATVTPTSVSGTAGTPIHATFNFTSGVSIQKVEALNLASGARFSPSINGKSATATYDWGNPIAMTGGHLNLKVTDTHGKETPLSIAFNIAAAAPATISPASVTGFEGKPLHVDYTFTSGISIQSITAENLATGAKFVPSINGKSATASYDWSDPSPKGIAPLSIKLTDIQGKITTFSVPYTIEPVAPVTGSPLKVSGTVGRPLHVDYKFSSALPIKTIKAVNLASGATFVPTINGTTATAAYDWANPVKMSGAVLNIVVTDSHDNSTKINVTYDIGMPTIAPPTLTPTKVSGTAGQPINVNYEFTAGAEIKSIVAQGLAPGATFVPTISGNKATAKYSWSNPTAMSGGVLTLVLTDIYGNATPLKVTYNIAARAPIAPPTLTPTKVSGTAGQPINVNYEFTAGAEIKSIVAQGLAPGATFVPTISGNKATAKYSWSNPTVMSGGVLTLVLTDIYGNATPFKVTYNIAARAPIAPPTLTPTKVSGTAGQPINVNYEFTAGAEIKSIVAQGLAPGATFVPTISGNKATAKYSWANPTVMSGGVLTLVLTDIYGNATPLKVTYNIAARAPASVPVPVSTSAPGSGGYTDSTRPLLNAPVVSPTVVSGVAGQLLNVNYEFTSGVAIKSIVAQNLASGASFVPTINGYKATAKYSWSNPVAMSGGVLNLIVTDINGKVTTLPVTYNIKARAPVAPPTLTPTKVSGTAGQPINVNYEFTAGAEIKSIVAQGLAPGATFVPTISGNKATAKYSWANPTVMSGGVLTLVLTDIYGNATPFKVTYNIAARAPIAPPTLTPTKVSGTAGQPINVNYVFTAGAEIKSIVAQGLAPGATFVPTISGNKATAKYSWANPTVMSGGVLTLVLTDIYGNATPFKVTYNIAARAPIAPPTLTPTKVSGTAGQPINVNYEFTAGAEIKSIVAQGLAPGATFVPTISGNKATAKYSWANPTVMSGGVLTLVLTDIYGNATPLKVTYNIAARAPASVPVPVSTSAPGSGGYTDSTRPLLNAPVVSPTVVSGVAGQLLNVNYEFTSGVAIKSIVAQNLASGASFVPTINGYKATAKYSWSNPVAMSGGVLNLIVTDINGKVTTLPVTYNIKARAPVAPPTLTPTKVSGTAGQPINVNYEFTAGAEIKSIVAQGLAPGATFVPTISGNKATAKYSWANPTVMSGGVLTLVLTDIYGNATPLKVTYNIAARAPASVPVPAPTSAPASGSYTDTTIPLLSTPMVSPTVVSGVAGQPLNVNYEFTSGVQIKSIVAQGLAPGATFVPTINGYKATAKYSWSNPVAMSGGVLNLIVTDINGKVTTLPVTYNIKARELVATPSPVQAPTSPAPAPVVSPVKVSGVVGQPLNVKYEFTSELAIKSIEPQSLPSGATFVPATINGNKATGILNWPNPGNGSSSIIFKVTSLNGIYLNGSPTTTIKADYDIVAPSGQAIMTLGVLSMSPTLISGTVGKPLSVRLSFHSPKNIKSITGKNLPAGMTFSTTSISNSNSANGLVPWQNDPHEIGGHAEGTLNWANPTLTSGGKLTFVLTDTYGNVSELNVVCNIAADSSAPSTSVATATITPTAIMGNAGRPLNVTFTFTSPAKIKKIEAQNLASGAKFDPKINGTNATAIYTWSNPTEMNGNFLNIVLTDVKGKQYPLKASFTIGPPLPTVVSPTQVQGTASVPLNVKFSFTSGGPIKSIEAKGLATGAKFSSVVIKGNVATGDYSWPDPKVTSGSLTFVLSDKNGKVTSLPVKFDIK